MKEWVKSNKSASPAKIIKMKNSKTNWLDVLVIYSTAFLIGLSMVSFPASSTYLKQSQGLTDGQYGFIFIPQIITAVFGAIAGGTLARNIGLKKILAATLAANFISQSIFLSAIVFFTHENTYYAVLLATSFFGLSFGLAAAPTNTYPGLIFPRKNGTALVALHAVIGAGLALGPSIVGYFTSRQVWYIYPVSLAAISLLLLIFLPFCTLPDLKKKLEKTIPEKNTTLLNRKLIWLFVIIAILYSFAEGTFSNWAVVYLNEEKGIPITSASVALSVFWAMLAFGRLAASLLLLKISSFSIWIFLPILMVIIFLILPFVVSPLAGILVFGLAGLSCSAFFPTTVDLLSSRFKEQAAFVSSLMIAALMTGVGVGSYLIGVLKSYFQIEQLYRLSAIYPFLVVVIAIYIKIKYYN